MDLARSLGQHTRPCRITDTQQAIAHSAIRTEEDIPRPVPRTVNGNQTGKKAVHPSLKCTPAASRVSHRLPAARAQSTRRQPARSPLSWRVLWQQLVCSG